jgi:hypothetical protein
MLQQLVPEQLWTGDVPASRGGFNFGARMTLVRLPDGALWVHSPVALAPFREEVDRLGPVRHLVGPSKMHYEHLAEWAGAYPEARVYAAASLKGNAKVPPHQTLGDESPAEWQGAIEQVVFRGSRLFDEVVFFHPATRTLILTDLCFNVPSSRGWSTALWAGVLGFKDRFAPSRSFGLMLQDREAARASLERILGWDFDRVLLTHGDYLETGGKEAFRRAFARFI